MQLASLPAYLLEHPGTSSRAECTSVGLHHFQHFELAPPSYRRTVLSNSLVRLQQEDWFVAHLHLIVEHFVAIVQGPVVT
jgi:hypothetical protein